MLNDKKFARIEKVLGKDKLAELEALDNEGLKSAVTGADMSVKQALDQLEANPKYQEIKESLKALREGVTELRKHQGALVTYALHLIEEKGQS